MRLALACILLLALAARAEPATEAYLARVRAVLGRKGLEV